MTMIDKICAALADTGITFYYCKAPEKKAAPYIVYTDYYEGYDRADDRIDDIKGSVQVDYYTTLDFDGGKEVIRDALDARDFVFDVQHFYEAEQRLHHWVFDVTGAQ